MAHRQINVDEVWITSNEGESRWTLYRTRRRLSPIRDAVLMDAPDDVRGRSPVVAGIAQRKPLIERGVGPRHRAMVLEITSNRVAKPPSIAEVPGHLAERRRVVHTGKVGAWIEGEVCVARRLPPQATPPAAVVKSSTALTKRQPEW